MRKNINDLWPLDRRGTHAFLAASAVIGSFIFVIGLKFVFTPFFIALILAFILNPVVDFGERLAIPRWCTTCLLFVSMSLLTFFVVAAVIPSLVQEFHQLSGNNEMIRRIPEEIIEGIRRLAQTHISPGRLEQIEMIIRNWFEGLHSSGSIIKDTTLAMGQRFLAQLTKLTGLVVMLLLIPFYMFFLLTSFNKIWAFIDTYLVPYEYRGPILDISNKIDRSLSAFFRGRLIVCLLVGAISWVGLMYLEVPFPFLFGFGIGFATIVPMLGLLFLFPAMIFSWMAGFGVEEILYLMLFYSLVQGFEMFVLSPIILGKEMELSPMVLVLSIMISGYLFGAIGVVLAVPIASTTKILFAEFIFPSFVELSQKNTNSPRVIQKKK